MKFNDILNFTGYICLHKVRTLLRFEYKNGRHSSGTHFYAQVRTEPTGILRKMSSSLHLTGILAASILVVCISPVLSTRNYVEMDNVPQEEGAREGKGKIFLLAADTQPVPTSSYRQLIFQISQACLA